MIAGTDRLFWYFYEPQPIFTLQDVKGLSKTPPTILTLDQIALPSSLRETLQTQGWLRVTDTENGFYFYVYQDDGLITEIGPIKAKDEKAWLAPTLFYTALAMVLFILLYPIFRDLKNLRNSVDAFALSHDPRLFNFPHGFYINNVVVTLRTMSIRLMEMLQLTREVSDTLSHELRTPLARLRFTLATIQGQQNHEARQLMQEDICELDELIEEYLQYTQVENLASSLQLIDTPANELIAPIIQKYEQFSHCEIISKIDPELIIKVEPRLFIRIINNLLGNACKYGKKTVLVNLYKLDDVGWQLNVEDDGMGFGDSPSSLLMPFTQQNKLCRVWFRFSDC